MGFGNFRTGTRMKRIKTGLKRGVLTGSQDEQDEKPGLFGFLIPSIL
jgi:hypothetical protein